MEYEAFWVPSELPNAQALAIGEKWLREASYPGQCLIALHTAKMRTDDPSLARMATRYRVVSPLARGGVGRGGHAVLAVWASDRALQLAEELASQGGGVCVVEGGPSIGVYVERGDLIGAGGSLAPSEPYLMPTERARGRPRPSGTQ